MSRQTEEYLSYMMNYFLGYEFVYNAYDPIRIRSALHILFLPPKPNQSACDNNYLL